MKGRNLCSCWLVWVMFLLSVGTRESLACATCFGAPDAPMTQGLNMGIFSLLLVVLFVLGCAATFGIFLMSWVHTERQAGLMIGGFVTIMGMLGMLPVFVLSMPNPPQIVFTLSHLVPQGWAVEGLQIAMEGGAPADVIINSFVLLAWAALFFVIGVLRFRKRFA